MEKLVTKATEKDPSNSLYFNTFGKKTTPIE